MNITFIYPKSSVLKHGVPLGLAYLTAVLKQENYNVSIIDLRFQSEKELFSILKKKNPGIVGFYSSSEIASYVNNLAGKIKKELPTSTLVVGGPHATLDPSFFLKNSFDVVIKGEGEITVKELADAIEKKKSLKNIKGIVYKSGRKIIENRPQKLIEDLDKLPFPSYESFPFLKETLQTDFFWTSLRPNSHILTSRGCPFHCAFCQPTLKTMFGSKVRRMSPKRIFELMTYLKESYKVKEIFFEDDLLMHKAWKKWFFELTGLMKKNRLDIRWWGQSRADSSNRQILKEAKKAGCYMVMCGVESGSQKILDFYNKNISPGQVRNLFKTSKEVGLLRIAEIIFGAPTENLDDGKKTVQLMREIKPDGVSVCTLTPYPGTYLYKWLEKNRIGFEKNLSYIDRTIQKKRIQSKLTNKDIHNLKSKISLNHPTLSLMKKNEYRQSYLLKIKNLSENKDYSNVFKLGLRTIYGSSPPIIKRIYYSIKS